MKKIHRNFVLTAICTFLSFVAIADKNPEDGKVKSGKKISATACLPAAAYKDLDLNNVRARINTGGDMWWDLIGSAKYEIPKDSRKTSAFSASLWMAGVDVNGQLKCSAQRYRGNGNDFWTGPLSTDGKASIDAATCQEYDKHFNIKRSEVNEFIAWKKDPSSYPDYKIPSIILNWPAHGDISKNQSYYLAPFFDMNGDGTYNAADGDYPYYDINNSLCKQPDKTMEGNGILVDQVLKGDQTLWWVFNDKGNIHTETTGAAIGTEIRAQAFAFATNDEINNMTFYSYEIINRSTFRLTETYFSLWVDLDLGYAYDDYVGCDILRGLGYCYNGKAEDGSGKFDHYGLQPPAIGVDFFQGPYIDKDGLDNPRFDAFGKLICDVGINGVNFGDTIVDNERFGMRKFVYHNNTGGLPAMTDPRFAAEYYLLLRGFWKDGTHMQYGGNAHIASSPPAYGPACDFMFPGNTDPCYWGTGGKIPNGPVYWTEETAKNTPYDRRFMQSAGPFTLEPGAVNYITVGIPWARASAGGPFASVELLRQVDDKCQRLFDNCFKVVDGPDAPDMLSQELDKEIILYVTNRRISNNYNEAYVEWDPSIVSADTQSVRFDSLYRFEGYQIFQVRNASVSVSELKDPDMSRLVAQCDIKNGAAQLVNYNYSEAVSGNMPVEEVNGANAGISHSFRIKEDKFATGDRALVNHKKYYYIAIAYAYNNFKPYSQDPADPSGLFGQKRPYLAGRKTSIGTSISSITVIPHKTDPELGGTVLNSKYGDGPKITRIEGQGNGGNNLDFTKETIENILKLNKVSNPEYVNGYGPINVKVIDPLSVKKNNYILKFLPNATTPGNLNLAKWMLIFNNGKDTILSDTTITVANEQLLLNHGLSISIGQVFQTGDHAKAKSNGFIESSIVFADSSKRWLTGLSDNDGSVAMNWIRSGNREDPSQSLNNDYDVAPAGTDPTWLDPNEDYEKILGGTWAPYRLCSRGDGKTVSLSDFANGPAWNQFPTLTSMANLASVDVVFTSDKSKWTRCPVIELQDDKVLAQGAVEKFNLRNSLSVNKEGQPDGTGTKGMGWFPGYAINVETGQRLNMMFGEDSWLVGDNGGDMLWNPTRSYFTSLGNPVFGGKHYIYVMGYNTISGCPAYDEGSWIFSKLSDNNYLPAPAVKRLVYTDAMWVGIPMANFGFNIKDPSKLPTDVKVRIRVAKPYKRYYSIINEGSATPQNADYPMYTFHTNDIAVAIGQNDIAKTALDLIRVVPNPYYAFSLYEENQVDNRVKITNLPDKCTISIYTMNGTLVRQFTKDDIITSIDWDLKNHAGIPISGGMYLMYIKAPGIGEKVVKWFGGLRPTDLNSF